MTTHDTPPKVIALIQQKGGVGKSTLALNLAAAFSLQGERVLLVDADPNHNCQDWAEERKRGSLFTMVGCATPKVRNEILNMAPDYDRVIIDTPPSVEEINRSALSVADMAVIPVKPSFFDRKSLGQVELMVANCQILFPNLRAAFLINGAERNTKALRKTRKDLREREIPTLPVELGKRAEFANTLDDGLTVLEAVPKHEASLEIKRLAALFKPTQQRKAA